VDHAATTRGSSQHRHRLPPPFMPLPSPHITPARRHNLIHAVEQRTSRLSLRTSIATIPPRHLMPGANLHCQNRAAAEPYAPSRGVRARPRASNPPCFLPRSLQWGCQFSLVDPSRRPDSASAPHRGRAHLAVTRRLRDIATGGYGAHADTRHQHGHGVRGCASLP
jgi:hypothetical protein